MRLQLCLAVIFIALAAPPASMAHGTERHYGNSFGEKVTAEPPAPMFSIMLVENALRAIRLTFQDEAEEDIVERLQRVERSTAALLYTTADGAPDGSEFESFASSLKTHAPLLLRALNHSENSGDALSAVAALESSFNLSKRRYRNRVKDS